MSEHLAEKLKEAIINCEETEAEDLAKEIVKLQVDPLDIIKKYLSPAMKIVGEKFEKGEYFLMHLMIAGQVMEKVMNIFNQVMKADSKEKLEKEREKAKKIVVGTVQGDIHDIGKNILASLLRSNSYSVFDLGKDVSAKKFVEKAEEVNADIIALSALLTVTMASQADVINLLKEKNLRGKYKVIVGGGPTTQEWADEIGADGWAPDAIKAVEVVNHIFD